MAEPIGTEFQVNTYTTGDQLISPVTTLSDGSFVVVWMSNGQDGSGYGVYGQRYNADGTPNGSEFQVNTYTTDWQGSPSVTALSDGGFVVVWMSNGQDGSGNGVYGQRYNADGTSNGSEFQVNTYTTSYQGAPSVTALSDDGFVVVWSSWRQDGSGYGVYGQRYNADGTSNGSEFQVNTYTTVNQIFPSVTTLSDGGFVVVWQSDGQDGSGNGVYGQRYNADGTSNGSEFQVNTYTTDWQGGPSVTALSDGSFVVVWMSNGQDGSGNGVYGQRYNADGTPNGSEFQVNTYTTGEQFTSFSSVTALSDGGFVVVWNSIGQDGSGNGVYGQRYNADGTSNGSEFQVNTYTTDWQGGASVTALSDDGFVVVWTSLDGQDGSGAGIYGQLYGDHASATPTIGISALDATKPEGDTGVTEFTFEIALSEAQSTETVVDWELDLSEAQGVASIQDFTQGTTTSGQITVPAGETSITLSFGLIGDTFFEWIDEAFSVVLTAVTGGVQIAEAASSAQGLIQEDDAGAEANGLRYPVGDDPSAQLSPERNDDDWYTAQDLGTLNTDLDPTQRFFHLGEDWNYDYGRDDENAPVYSIYEGEVVYLNENHSGFGKVVVIKHDLPEIGEVYSLYAHLNEISVDSGTVGKNVEIGKLGKTPIEHGYDPHLHFEIFSIEDGHTLQDYMIGGTPEDSKFAYTQNEDAYFGENDQGVTAEFSYTEGGFTWYNPSLFIEQNLTLEAQSPVETTVSTSAPGGSYYGTVFDDSFAVTTPETVSADVGIFKQGADVLIQFFDSAKNLLLKSFEEISIFGGGKNDSLLIGDLSGTSISQETIYFYGNGGRDTLDASETDRRIVADGGGQRDELIGGSGNDELFGGDARDTLIGNAGEDTLNGGDARDLLVGGRDNDLLTGGRQLDTFVFAPGDGDDIITDLELKEWIDLTAYGFEDEDDVLALAAQQGADTVIELSATDSILLQDFMVSNLDEDYFLI